jgi:sugar phosphate permease
MMIKRVFYGWFIVGICLMAMIISAGMGFYSIGVFFNPLMDDFGWNRTQVSAIVTVYWGVIAIAGPLVGRFLDVHGAAKTMFFGLMGSSLFLSLLSLTPSLLYFYIIYACLSASHTALSSIPYGYLISRWFIKRRGTAMGIATAGIGIGGLVISPIVNALITSYGWRNAYLISGLGVLALMFPLLMFVKDSPEEMGLSPDGGEGAEIKSSHPGVENVWTAREAIRSPVFWLASFGLFLVYGTVFGTLSHEVPFIRDMGISPARAAIILAFTAGIGVIGKLVYGYLMDKLSPRIVIASCFFLQSIGLIILLFTKTMIHLWIFVIIFGFSMGGTATLRPLIVTWLFGIGSYGTIFGAMQVLQSIGPALFPLLGGLIFDATGNYQWAFILFMSTATISGFIYLLIPVPSKPNCFH